MKKIAVLIVFSLWYFLSLLLDASFLPQPHKVLQHTYLQFLNADLSLHFFISAYRIGIAMAAAVLIAAPLAILAGRNALADTILSPMAQVLYPIPKVALLPIVMLFFGLGDASKIILIVLIIFFQLFFVIRDAAAGIDQRYIHSIRSLGASKTDILVHVTIPAALPGLFTALRVSTGTAAAVLFLAESFASITGLGWYIIDSWARLDYLDMYAGIVTLSILGALFFFIFDGLERYYCRWRRAGTFFEHRV